MILHLSHDSTFILEDLRQDFLLSDNELQEKLNWITDHATDVIFQKAFPKAHAVVFPVSRLVLDPERLSEVFHETMSQVVMGATYTRDHCVSRYASYQAKVSARNYLSDSTILITKNLQRQLRSLS